MRPTAGRWASAVDGFITGVYQHVGSRYTQMADQADGFGTFGIRSFGDPTITTFTFDPLLPAYDIGNLRLGVRGDDWEAALFVNNWPTRTRCSASTRSAAASPASATW